MASKKYLLGILVMVLAFGITTFGCNNDPNSPNDPNNPNNPNNVNETWLSDKQTVYTISDGIVEGILYSYDVNYLYYTNDKNYSIETRYIEPINLSTGNTAVAIVTTGYREQNSIYTRTGDTSTQTLDINQMSTTKTNYSDPIYHYLNSETKTHIEQSIIHNSVFDSDTGLTLQTTSSVIQITNGGAPVVSNSTANYTIEVLSNFDGIKTIKYTPEGMGIYQVYRINNNVTLEIKSYSSSDVLIATMSFTFPDSTVIRNRLPGFTLYSTTYEELSENNTYQTVEVLSSTATQLELRTKTFREGTLIGQTDVRYSKKK